MFDESARALLDDIQTIEALDMMCLLAREPKRARTADELAEELRLDRSIVDETIRHLRARGLLRSTDDGVQVVLAHASRECTMASIRRLCDEDRPNLLGAIAQLSIERVRASAARTLVSHSLRDPEDA
jgi:DNA-binding IscR family transcriptional regulator